MKIVNNKNFLLTVDDLFTKKECEHLLNTYNKNLILPEKNSHYNYLYKDIEVNTFPFLEKLVKITCLYRKKYPESDLVAMPWKLNYLRFKLFKKGKSFVNFHSVIFKNTFHRFLSIQIYLTNHKCGTEFFRTHKTISSKIGRVCIFPAYFTHTHKGQPDIKKERAIITGYYTFYEKI